MKKHKRAQLGMIARIVFLSAIVGGSIAVISTVFTGEYLNRYIASLDDVTEEQLRLAEEKPEPVPGTFEEAAEKARESLLPSIAHLYPNVSTSLAPGDEIGLGVVVTSDGWVVTTDRLFTQVFPDPTSLRAQVGTRFYDVDALVIDELTDAVMLHLSEANSLPVIAFGASNTAAAGDLIFIGSEQGGLSPSAVVNPSFWTASVQVAAEVFTHVFSYEQVDYTVGASVVNSNGELIAVENIPLHHTLPFIRSVIRSGEVSRASFDATVIDLYRVEPAATIEVQGFYQGVYVVFTTPGGSAATAGVEAGDVITEFGGEIVNGTESFAEMISSFNPGQTIPLVVSRDGEFIELVVELGEL